MAKTWHQFFQDDAGKFSRTAARVWAGIVSELMIVSAWVFTGREPPESLLLFVAAVLGIDTFLYRMNLGKGVPNGTAAPQDSSNPPPVS